MGKTEQIAYAGVGKRRVGAQLGQPFPSTNSDPDSDPRNPNSDPILDNWCGPCRTFGWTNGQFSASVSYLRLNDRRASVGEIQVSHPFLARSGKEQLARVALELKNENIGASTWHRDPKNMKATDTSATPFAHENLPNPAKLIDSLRYLGYDNYTAVADLVDNSWDASAKIVRVAVRTRDKENEIILADDGSGMSASVLSEAIKLGSMAEKDPSTDLGKFGMGLVTASLSIARQTIVLSKAEGGPLLKAINDVDEVIRTNRFVSYLGKSTKEDEELFKEFLGESSHGTVVILRKCDRMQNYNPTLFARQLSKHLARVFRYFLTAEREIYVNADRIEKSDPLMWENAGTDHFCDEKIPVEFTDGDAKVKDVIHVKLAILPDNPGQGDAASSQNIKTQGFYVMRNNREILDANTLGLFTKHNSFNRFRGEIIFSGTLDKFLGVDFTKSGVKLNQSAADQLNQFLTGQLKTIRSRIQRSQRAETPADVADVHRSAEQEIHKKSKLLMVPKAPKEERAPATSVSAKSGEELPAERGREPRAKQQPGGFAANCRFEAASLGEEGPIYECEQQGRTIIVRWNSDHQFYKKFVLDNAQDKSLLAAADYLVYSLACAELMFSNEESMGLVQNFKATMSVNLRMLLS